MYKRQIEQLRFLCNTISRMHKSGKWNGLTADRKRDVLLKLKYLFAKLRNYLNHRELRHVLASIALVAGAHTAGAQQFGAMQQNPFGLTEAAINTGNTIQLADLENDGDFDMIGATFHYDTDSTSFFYRENTGTKTNPQFGPEETNPFGLFTLISMIHMSAAVDMDNDGDLDLIAVSYGNPDPILYYENVGTNSDPDFAFPELDPFNINSSLNFGLPSLAAGDLDDDGDPDLMFFSYDDALFFENTGTPANPDFADPVSDAFNISQLNGTFFGATLADMDKDGDLDLWVNDWESGRVFFFENEGTWTNPDFGPRQINPFGLSAINGKSISSLASADLDDDGDNDLLFTDFAYSYATYSYYSNNYYFENTETTGTVDRAANIPVNVYPQPCSEFVVVDLSGFPDNKICVAIYGLDGVSCFASELAGSQIHVIPVDHLPAGMYLLEIKSSQSTYTRKIIKQ